MAEDVNEQLLRYLNDAYAVEVWAISSLRDLSEAAMDTDVRQAVTEHLAVTQSQADRLSARLLALGGDKSEPKGFLNSIIGKGSDLLNVFHSHEDKQAQDVIQAYSLQHFEVVMYTSLKACADAIGDHETAQLADTIIGEE